MRLLAGGPRPMMPEKLPESMSSFETWLHEPKPCELTMMREVTGSPKSIEEVLTWPEAEPRR